jgi:hypothetical protein
MPVLSACFNQGVQDARTLPVAGRKQLGRAAVGAACLRADPLCVNGTFTEKT